MAKKESRFARSSPKFKRQVLEEYLSGKGVDGRPLLRNMVYALKHRVVNSLKISGKSSLTPSRFKRF